MSGELPAALCHQCNFYGSLAQLPPEAIAEVADLCWFTQLKNGDCPARYVNVYQRVPLLTVLSEVILSDSYHGDDRYDGPWVLIRLEGLSNDKNLWMPFFDFTERNVLGWHVGGIFHGMFYGSSVGVLSGTVDVITCVPRLKNYWKMGMSWHMVSAFQGPVLVDLGFLGSQLWSMAIKQTIEAKNAWSWMIDIAAIAMRQPGYGISSSSQIGVDFGEWLVPWLIFCHLAMDQ